VAVPENNGSMSASELPVVTEAWASRSGGGCRHRMLEGSSRYLALRVVPVFLMAD
jgi:hypothetical protein